MEFQRELYCSIFVSAKGTYLDLARQVAEIVGGEIDASFKIPHYVNIGRSTFHVGKNGYHDPRDPNVETNFVIFPYAIEAEALPEQTREAHIEIISTLLRGLWGLGIQAVAACDFEDELPPNPSRLDGKGNFA